MFWYAIALTGSFDNLTSYDDVCVTDDRGMAYMAMLICGLPVRVSAK